ncbi:MAG: hypothetical protein PHR36_03685 [Patescibacteria group bacterium]|nr:hypothetical protein [Patescibacteria group bacterium]
MDLIKNQTKNAPVFTEAFFFPMLELLALPLEIRQANKPRKRGYANFKSYLFVDSKSS